MSLSIERIESLERLFYTRARCSIEEAVVTETEKSSRHWSDQKADIVALLTIFGALLLAAINFISRQV